MAREDWAEIAAFQLPSTLSIPDRREAGEVIQFFQSVAEIVKPDGNPAAAEAMLSTLVGRHSGNVAYRANLFAARVRRLAAANSFGLLSGATLSDAKRFLAEAERDLRPLLVSSPLELKSMEGNRALLLLACGRNHDCLRVLFGLPESDVDVRIEGLRALALARMGSKREAFALLAETATRYGANDFLEAVHANIDSHRPFIVRPGVAVDNDPVPGILHSFHALRGLSHVEQAAVLDPHGTVENYLLDHVRGACGSVASLAPTMRGLQMDGHEDHISLVLKHMLLSRLNLVQWAVEDQSLGGNTANGNLGERDIAIKKDAATLAILEALVATSVATRNLSSHFRKLFAYDTCVNFFHLTYARHVNGPEILNFLRTACMSASPGITYIRQQPLNDSSSLPVGFKAFYTIGQRNVTVTFLVLELGLELQRAAAVTAAAGH